MAWIADGKLAAAVSEGGGLGIVAAGNAPADYVREQIRIAKSLTKKPFGLNIMLMSPFADDVAQVAAEEHVAVVTTGAGNPTKYMQLWKDAGIRVIPVVASASMAKLMTRLGASALIAEGGESGGHVGELTTMVLVPLVCDATNLPVLAAGGNHQFVSAEGQWKVSLTKGFIALSTYGYTRWEEFAQRLDRVLAAFIETYHPSWLTRVGLRYVNAFRREALGLEDMLWKELITPGFLGLMAEPDAQETAFLKQELTATFQTPGGAKANVKSGPGLLRKINNRTRETTEEKVFMLDLDLYMDGKTELGHAVPALNIVHENAGSLFRSAMTETLRDAMEPQEP